MKKRFFNYVGVRVTIVLVLFLGVLGIFSIGVFLAGASEARAWATFLIMSSVLFFVFICLYISTQEY